MGSAYHYHTLMSHAAESVELGFGPVRLPPHRRRNFAKVSYRELLPYGPSPYEGGAHKQTAKLASCKILSNRALGRCTFALKLSYSQPSLDGNQCCHPTPPGL